MKDELKHYENISVDEIKSNIKFASEEIKDLVEGVKNDPSTMKTNEFLINRWEDKIELYERILKLRHGKETGKEA